MDERKSSLFFKCNSSFILKLKKTVLTEIYKINLAEQHSVLLYWTPNLSKLHKIILVFYTGSRHVIDEDSICVKEDEWLANYLSNCKFDKENHHIDLPEKNDQEDQGFKCIFYREAKERMFEVFADEECFTVIVLDQKGWDSDAKGKRPQKQVGTSILFLIIDK